MDMGERAAREGQLHFIGNMRRRVRVLDLCAGTKSLSRALRRLLPNAKVITVDADAAFSPTIVGDVRRWDPLEAFGKGYFDIIWASPPCTEYSRAKTTGVRDLHTADDIVKACRRIITALQPRAWFIENPHALLRTRECMTDIEHLRNTVTYCHYGYDYRKETDLWTNIDVGELPRCTICTPCRWMKIMGRHPRVAQAGGGHDGRPGVQAHEAYTVPPRLLRHLILRALSGK